MSPHVRLNRNGVTFEQEVLGGIDTHQTTIDWNETDEYEIRLGNRGWYPLSAVFAHEPDDSGGVEQVSMDLASMSSVEPEIRPRSEGQGDSDRQELPPVPDADGFANETHERFYSRLQNNPGSQPATMRQIIHSEDELSKGELSRRMSNEGYEPSGGGFAASLVVLDEVTDEINREGSGENTRISWTGGSDA